MHFGKVFYLQPKNKLLKHSFHRNKMEAGCDEAGRGCLCGPVYAAAVILPKKFRNSILNDSKQLTDKQRKELRPIIEAEAIDWAVGIVSAEEIDEINILRASFLAMHRAIKKLKIVPEHLLIDGNRFTPFEKIPHTCIIEGDAKYKNIAAASILAKTYRDDYMDALHEKFPEYNWMKNKGYGTKQHRDAIIKFGVTDHHRKSFRLILDQLEIEF